MLRAMRIRPHRLNTLSAALFLIGSFGFALGSVHAYASAVGVTADAVTFFVSSVFFTSASFLQLVQAQSPDMAPAAASQDVRPRGRRRAWLPHDRAWLAAATQFPGTLFFNVTTGMALVQGLSAAQYDKVVWRPDFYGSVLFLVSSAFAILALGRFWRWRPGDEGWRIAWLNMVGSVAFMVSAIGSYVIPKTDQAISLQWADAGTFIGAVCFFLGAWLMVPAWHADVREATRVASAD